MSSEYQSLLNYLSVTRLENSDATLDMGCLSIIREKFNESYDDNDDLRHKTIEKVMDDLKITNDPISLEYFDLAVQQRSDGDAKLEIIDKFRGSVKSIEPTISGPSKSSSANQSIEDQVVTIKEITCIIHKKSNRSEIETFINDFLFKQIPSSNSSSTDNPVVDDNLPPSSANTMIDLFIRQLMIDRGTITFNRPQMRFRLVEPISLTDEFESWTFDHFHGLLDFWLTLNKNPFPKQWKLDPQAKIEYIIRNHLNTTDDDQTTTKNIERPSTKSLENFLRDICQIEDNGMFDEWYKGLTEKENINTYAHLTNLNQKEWEQIRELPMNALKTIKSYVDREKQMVEQRKSKKTKDENPSLILSESELRANLHMIKLYFIRQLEDHDGIEPLPRLDKFCVDKAFKEMRAEGYEDDGLFDDMKLFFQPLTVTDSELAVDPKLFDKLLEEESKEKIRLAEELKTSSKKLREANRQVIGLDEQLISFRQQKEQISNKFFRDSKKPENKDIREQIELRKKWLKDDQKLQKYIDLQDRLMRLQATEILDIEVKKDRIEELLKGKRKLPKLTQKIDRKLVKPHRGFIMYGPPGTGKSVIMSKLAKKIGIAMLGPPLAAGELERPLVGQSEAIILDLCMRGNRLPHLMCCVSIDEIDSLAPRRDEDSSEGKVAKISVLLSVIEGIKDVPNLMFFSATNRLHMMDEAFLRRMSGKFFVGRPSSDARKRILNEIPRAMLRSNIREKLLTATTNFSGAALRALMSAITVHYLAKRRENGNYEIKEEDALLLADQTARQYQLFLGLDTLPRLLLHNLDNLRELSNDNQQTNSDGTLGFHLSKTRRFTGKILISLSDKCVRIEAIENKNGRSSSERIENQNQRYIMEDKLQVNEQTLRQLLERITSYGNDRNVQLLQLIDLNLLSSKGAHDEKKIFETLKERYDECMEYKRSMIIYDLDSLVGVNKSESESSTGRSTNSSVVNESIYTYITSRFYEAKIEASRSDDRQNIERWAIAVIRDPFLLRKFTTDVDFTLTSKQKEQEEQDRQRSSEVLTCVKCRNHYIESENKMGACCYHDGFVFDNLSSELTKYKPSEAIDLLIREEHLNFKNPLDKENMTEMRTRLKYICCYATVQVGAGSNGCKKGKHVPPDTTHINDDSRSLNEQIKKWETKCMEDFNYEEKWYNLKTQENI